MTLTIKTILLNMGNNHDNNKKGYTRCYKNGHVKLNVLQ